MTANDYKKFFDSAKKNFIAKNPPANPKKSPFSYLDAITAEDVLFEPQSARIYKVRYDYNVSARYHAYSGNNESYGNTDNYYSTTGDIYHITNSVPDEVKKIYDVSTTFYFYAEFETWKAIENDAKPKLATFFRNSGANYCSSSDVYVTIKSQSKATTPETWRQMDWSYIYLKDKRGNKGKCIGITYCKNGTPYYKFYRQGKGKTVKDIENKKKAVSNKEPFKFNFGKTLINVLAIVLIAFIVLTTLAKGWTKFEVTTSASGFSINRSSNWSYSIDELGIKQKSNNFYLEDYFVSEELGEEYTIKGRFFPMGKVKLAKKSEHYNQQEYNFNLIEYHNRVITITENMNYVRIYSNSGSTVCTYIRIEKRSTPVDIILENANILSAPGVPAICSVGICDVNIIARGNCSLQAGRQTFTVEDLKKMVKTNITDPLIRSHYEDLTYVYNEIQYWNNGKDKTFGEIYEHYGLQLANSLLSFTEGAFNFVVGGASMIIGGRKGDDGAAGSDTIIILGGLSVKCEGNLRVEGGRGGNGLNASNSLAGTADGGDGGNGGDGICCLSFITADTYGEDVLTIEGGAGGNGGEPSKGGFGLLGSSGSRGNQGRKGIPIALPEK
ncbi:MAG: hypothetical protein IKA85_07000 [Clostridia bacterium]|nr:hypothetical protein [Clostridia bacterium]